MAKRKGDSDDTIFFRVNEELSHVLQDFTNNSSVDKDDDDEHDDGEKAYVGDFGDTMGLGFKAGESHAVIPGIRGRNAKTGLPREDGYVDNDWERATAQERPYGNAYFNEQLEREKLMEQSSDYRFVVLLAGAMGKSPIDIYQEEDLDRLLRQREAERTRLQLEMRRTIVPLEEKQRQRVLLEQQMQRLIKDQETFGNERYSRLNTVGRYLIDGQLDVVDTHTKQYGLSRLELLRQDLTIISSLPVVQGAVDAVDIMARKKKVIAAHKGDDETIDDEKNRKEVFTTEDEQLHASFIVLVLFRYYFDNQAWWGRAAIVLYVNRLYADHAQKMTSDIVHKLSIGDYDTISSAVPTLPVGLSSDQVYDNVSDARGGIRWSLLRGTETVVMPLVEEFYDRGTIAWMVDQGLHFAYGQLEMKNNGRKYNYAKEVLSYLEAGSDANWKATGPNRTQSPINIFEDHPKPILDIFHAITDRYDERIVRRLLQSHYLWKYFENRSALGLAIEWVVNEKKTSVETSQIIKDDVQHCYNAIAIVKSLLLFYFSTMIALCDRNKTPLTLNSERMFKFPSNITSIRFTQPYTSPVNPHNFDRLNQLFPKIDPLNLINNSEFRQYNIDGSASFTTESRKKTQEQQLAEAGLAPPMAKATQSNDDGDDEDDDRYTKEPLVMNRYPILRLHTLFENYDKFIGLYLDFLARRLIKTKACLQAVDHIIAQVSAEDELVSDRRPSHPFYEQRLAYTGQPINSGIIKLKSVVVLFMNKAYNLIRQYCSGLHDIAQEDLQTKSAFDCGLEGDYASFVAALIAENQNIYAVSYKSLHSQRNTTVNTCNAMARLKRYGSRVNKQGRREFYVAEEHGQPVLKKQRTNSSRYVLM